jgi:hypothetical protein
MRRVMPGGRTVTPGFKDKTECIMYNYTYQVSYIHTVTSLVNNQQYYHEKRITTTKNTIRVI